MSLTLVPVPIGNPNDFTVRGLQALRDADVIVVEEFKESSAWLRNQGISGKEMLQLNEHSTEIDIKALREICAVKNAALITDCGTPGFCDPGAHLVRSCRKHNVPVVALPGASSLMLMLSLSSRRIDSFYFRGFLSAKSEVRAAELLELRNFHGALILMDTPYRLTKMINEVSETFVGRMCLVGGNLTQENEFVIEAMAENLVAQVKTPKAEFMVLIYPK